MSGEPRNLRLSILLQLLILSFLIISENILAEINDPDCKAVWDTCIRAGFVSGEFREGRGLGVHCVRPIMQNVWDPSKIPGIKIALPLKTQALQKNITNCKRKFPEWGKGEIGYIEPVVTSTTIPTPTSTSTTTPRSTSTTTPTSTSTTTPRSTSTTTPTSTSTTTPRSTSTTTPRSTSTTTPSSTSTTTMPPTTATKPTGNPSPPLSAPTQVELTFTCYDETDFSYRYQYVELSWLPPLLDGFQSIKSYHVQIKAKLSRGPSEFSREIDSGSEQPRFLVPGGWYGGDEVQFRVAAVDSNGVTGEYSVVAMKTVTHSCNSAPNFWALPGDKLLTASFYWPSGILVYDEPPYHVLKNVIDYRFEYQEKGETVWKVLPHNPPSPTGNNTVDNWGNIKGSPRIEVTVPGLKNGVDYNVRVAYVTELGVGPFFRREVTPKGPPEQPKVLGIQTGSSEALISWGSPGSDGGSPVTNYLIRYSSNGGTIWNEPVETSGFNYFYKGLTPGLTYTFQVAAKNYFGTGPFSDSSASVTIADGGLQLCPVNVTYTGPLNCNGNDKRFYYGSRGWCSGCGGDGYGNGTYWFKGSSLLVLPTDAQNIDVVLETGVEDRGGTGFKIVNLQLGTKTIENARVSGASYQIDDRNRPTQYPSVNFVGYQPKKKKADLIAGRNSLTMTVQPLGCLWSDGGIGWMTGPVSSFYHAKLRGSYRAKACNPNLFPNSQSGSEFQESASSKEIKVPLSR